MTLAAEIGNGIEERKKGPQEDKKSVDTFVIESNAKKSLNCVNSCERSC